MGAGMSGQLAQAKRDQEAAADKARDDLRQAESKQKQQDEVFACMCARESVCVCVCARALVCVRVCVCVCVHLVPTHLFFPPTSHIPFSRPVLFASAQPA
jgi:hypothetical protein